MVRCSYFGVMAGKQVGSVIKCPLCSASVTAIKRNGHAYAPPHEPNYYPDTYIIRPNARHINGLRRSGYDPSDIDADQYIG